MNGYLVLAVGALTAIGVYLVTSRILSRIVLGFALLGHAVVLALITAGGRAGSAPIANRLDGAPPADPLPQALSLTAIVISFGLTLFLLALARRAHQLSGDDLVEDDIEDRRIARSADDSDAGGGDELDASSDDGTTTGTEESAR